MQRCHLKRHQAFRRIQVAPRMKGRLTRTRQTTAAPSGLTRRSVHVHVTRGPNVYATWDVLTFRMTRRPDASKDSRFFPVDLRWSMPLTGFNPSSFTMTESPPGQACSRLIATELSHVEYELGRILQFRITCLENFNFGWKVMIQPREKFATLLFFFSCEIKQ